VIKKVFDALRHRFFKALGAEFAYPGHFYSVIPSRKDRHEFLERSDEDMTVISGVEIDGDAMMQLLASFQDDYDTHGFSAAPVEGARYYYDNSAFAAGDALALYFMIRKFKPARMIEIGSGFSSAASLDINDRCCQGRMRMTFIEPYPARLQSLLQPEDLQCHTVVQSRLQDVDLKVFEQLQANDILFVDSTHVAKLGSDVNRILFEIFPSLNEGVIIHIHDIFWPFEYPKAWIREGRAWNEAYLLRAFLQYNENFEIIYFSDYLARKHHDWLRKQMPLLAEHPGGNIWLRKVH